MVGSGSQLSWSHCPRLPLLVLPWQQPSRVNRHRSEKKKVEHILKLETGARCATTSWSGKSDQTAFSGAAAAAAAVPS